MVDRIRREIRIPIYWLVVGLAVMLGSPAASIYASVQISKGQAERLQDHYVAAQAASDAKAAEAQAQVRKQSTKVLCTLFATILDGYEEEPPSTPAGKKQRDSWLQVYRISQCTPKR